jgi:hypothetical protein
MREAAWGGSGKRILFDDEGIPRRRLTVASPFTRTFTGFAQVTDAVKPAQFTGT